VKILITGANGQLARELAAKAPSGAQLLLVSRAECDITDRTAVEKVVKSFQAEIVINTAGYTAVDAAEEKEELAFAVNAVGARNVAVAANAVGARLIHISTDYVFDGESKEPYNESAPTHPLNIYGRSKLAGEVEVLSTTTRCLVVRTGWLHSAMSSNFAARILQGLAANSPLRVVNDQTGVPTNAGDLAEALWALATRVELQGILHWVNSGMATWYDFASAVADFAVVEGLQRKRAGILQISSDEFGATATRPSYSVLDARLAWRTLGEVPRDWSDGVRATIRGIAANRQRFTTRPERL
jgi:dTDP-4-dehydrorhamnose reductase